jgi:hypothetical protein
MTSKQDFEPFAQFGPWPQAAKPFIESGTKMAEQAYTRAIQVGSELSNFALQRMQEDTQLPQRLLTCRTPEEVQRTLIDYWQKSFSQYQAEWSRLAALSRPALPDEAQEAYEERRRRLAA